MEGGESLTKVLNPSSMSKPVLNQLDLNAKKNSVSLNVFTRTHLSL